MLFRRFALCALIFGAAGLCTEYARPHLGRYRFDARRPPYALAFSPDGKELVSAGQTGPGDVEIHRWTLASGERVDILVKNPDSYGYGSGPPDFPGPTLSVSADCQLAAFGGAHGTVFIWDTRLDNILGQFPAARACPTRTECSALSPDGKLLVRLDGCRSVQLNVLEISSGKTLGRIPGHSLYWVQFSADHQTLLVPDDPGGMAVWSVDPFKKLARLELPAPWQTLGTIAFSPDGKTVVAECGRRWPTFPGRTSLVWWNARTGEVIRQQEDLGMRFGSQFSRDSRTFAFAHGASLYVYNAKTGAQILRVRRPEHSPEDFSEDREDGFRGFEGPMAFAPDGRTLATSGTDGLIRLWDVRSGMELTAR